MLLATAVPTRKTLQPLQQWVMSPEVRRQIGERLRQARIAANLTQDDVARDFQVTRKAVSGWENAATLPTTRHLYEIGLLYGTSLDYLLYGMKTYPLSTKAVMKHVFPGRARSTSDTPERQR